jgi:NAD-dependent SIR2 family protein deacetylase
MEDRILQAAKAIAQADSVVITAGAGMGVDSGLPDFRGSDGFWRAYPAFAALGLRFAELASPVWFRRDPALAWGFYGHRRNLYRDMLPHAGFAILKGWAERMSDGAFVFTSNVDGQFQKAGFADAQIVECHGSIFHAQCSTPCSQALWLDAAPVAVDENTMRAHPPFPLCPHCREVARPNILMFNDGGWLEERTEQQIARFQTWLEQSAGEQMVVIEMGAGSAIPTVRHMSETLMRQMGATLIRINPREPEGPTGTLSLPMGAQAALEQIVAAIA